MILGDHSNTAPTQASLRLNHITSLSYSTWRDPSVTDASIDLSLQFDIKTDMTSTSTAYQGRLVYEPYYTHTVSDGVWQTWNPMDNSTVDGHGNWWFSHTNASGCTISAPCTWAQVLAAFPNIGISAGTDFKAGTWTADFTGNVDNFQIGTESGSTAATTTYDFDPAAVVVPPTPTPTRGGGGGGGGFVVVAGDINGDGRVDILDFNLLMAAWGTTGTNIAADVNHDGTVGILDFNMMLADWTL